MWLCQTWVSTRDLSKIKRDAKWEDWLREEYVAIINYIQEIKKEDADWFVIESDDSGLKWSGKCWVIYDQAKYEFKLEFEIPPTYPLTPIELVLPELDGKTEKMYRGGKICQDIHFAPHWLKNIPKYGIIHALVYGVM